jgi:hypothetical protein
MIKLEASETRNTPNLVLSFHPQSEQFTRLGRALIAFVNEVNNNFHKLDGNIMFSYTDRVVEPEPVAAEPEPVAVEPEPVAAEPEPVAVEPEPVAAEPEPVAVEQEDETKEDRGEIKTGTMLFSERLEEAKKEDESNKTKTLYVPVTKTQTKKKSKRANKVVGESIFSV